MTPTKAQCEEILNSIINPATKRNFGDEKRLQDLEMTSTGISIIYNRDGISPAEKREIEIQILEKLSPYFAQNQIMVKTVSRDSGDVYKAIESTDKKSEGAQSAELKVGHGTVGNKRPVPGVKKLIAVASGKGGVGKSTFTANLACTLSMLGLKVGVIDADIYGPSLPMLFGKRNEKPRATPEKKIIPIESAGIKFMSFGLFVNENDPVIWRGPMLGGVLSQFLFDVDWGDTDVLILDLPPGTGDIQLSMVQNAVVDGAIIISTPQDVALLDAVKGLEMFRKLNLPILGMVQNMSSFICDHCEHEHFIFGQNGVEKKVKDLNVDFLGSIPLEQALRESGDQGVPYMSNSAFKSRSVWKAYEEIGNAIKNKLGFGEVGKKSLLGKIFQIGQGNI